MGQKAIAVNRLPNGSTYDLAELNQQLSAGWTVNQTAVAGDNSLLVILDEPKPSETPDATQ